MKKVPLKEKRIELDSGLHVVSTPIGNLRDITLRAIDTLEAADVILCEDKRVTQKLLSAYGIKNKMMLYHDHNGERQRPEILKMLQDGQAVALVSDAGTPGISDPGYKLFCAVIDAGHKIYPVPGASAILSALTGAGLPTDTFIFEGFLPNKSSARKARFKDLDQQSCTMVFYEAGNRVLKFCQDLQAVMGERQVVLARELTKKFEEFIRGATSEVIEMLEAKKYKGEFVVLVGGISAEDWRAENLDDDILGRMLSKEMDKGLSVKDAAQAVADQTGVKKKVLYAMAVDLKNG